LDNIHPGQLREQLENDSMQYLRALALLLVIVGGVNWLLVGIARIDLVAALTGDTFGETNPISAVVYVLVGAGALALIPTLASWVAGDRRADRRANA
jgi:uncharacterized membrane protein YuzA (DUF378 family)